MRTEEENDVTAQASIIRILVADDHAIFREGVAAILSAQPDMQLVAQAADGEEAIAAYRVNRPDLVLMDLQMPGTTGLAAIRAIRDEDPQARIVVLTTYVGDIQITNALRAGATSYLIKSTLRNELVATIRAVFAGNSQLPPEVAAVIRQHLTDESLSAREIEVLSLVAIGFSNKRIAINMDISVETVKTHMKSILSKMKAKDRAEAVTMALRRGILEE
jgi:DNA-binding NarL/FixJ family response regulator